MSAPVGDAQESGAHEPLASPTDSPVSAGANIAEQEELASPATSSVNIDRSRTGIEGTAPTTLGPEAEKAALPAPLSPAAAQLRSADLSPNRAATKAYLPRAPGPRSAQYLNILVAGESGLGKSTFSHTFFRIDRPTQDQVSDVIRDATTRIEPIRVTQQTDRDTDFHIVIYDSVGWGNGSPNPDVSIDRIESFVLDKYVEHKSSPSVSTRGDPRIHCCFYFIAPHRLKDIDVEFMRRVSEHLLVIPIIAKADAMTVSELRVFKKKVVEQLEAAQIPTYPKEGAVEQRIFGVIGSESWATVRQCSSTCCARSPGLSEESVRGREYPWGTAIVDNPAHSDIKALEHLVYERYHDLHAAAERKYLHWHGNQRRTAFRALRTRVLHHMQLHTVLATSVLCLLIAFLVALALFLGVRSIQGGLHACHVHLRGAASDLRVAQDQNAALESQLMRLRGEVAGLHRRLEAEQHASSLLQEGHGNESSWFLQVLIAAAATWIATLTLSYDCGRKKEAAKRKWF